MKKYIDVESYCCNVCRCQEDKCDKDVCPIWTAPAAGVAEVRHRTWLNFAGDYTTAECSACGEVFEISDEGNIEHFEEFGKCYKYCPCCGARMDAASL